MSSQDGISGAGIDWIRGLEGAAVGGFASFLFGLLLQSLMSIANVDPTLTPFVAGVSTLGGVAYGFAKGSNAL
jgi:hypothetical protein